MTQRTIFGGQSPTVIIKAGADVVVTGWDSQQIVAETTSRGGLKVETRSQAEIGRARAAVGDHVLFDLSLKRPGGNTADADDDAIQVQIGSSGRVRLPYGSRVKVYAGKRAQVNDLQGPAWLYTGGDLHLRQVHTLAHVSAGGAVDLECESLIGDGVKLEAGRDLRCYVRQLTSARLMVNDLGGYWEGRMGAGSLTLRLKAGGDVILVTDQAIEPLGPNYTLGQIEKPVSSSS